MTRSSTEPGPPGVGLAEQANGSQNGLARGGVQLTRRASLRPDLILLAALLVLTAAFGREFSKLALGAGWLHPTEVLIAATAVAAIVGVGMRESLRAISRTGVLAALIVLWVAGAVATIKGLSDWGFHLVLHDVGLVEYSLLIPLVALVVRDRSDFRLLCQAIAVGGAVALAGYVVFRWAPPELSDFLSLISVATGMYIALFCVWVAARASVGAPVQSWHYALAAIGVALIILGRARAAWLGLALALLVIVVLSPAGRRLRSTVVIASILVAGVVASAVLDRIPSIPGWSEDAPVAVEKVEPAEEQPAKEPEQPAEPAEPAEPAPPALADELQESFAPPELNGGGGQRSNSDWRLAFWEHLVDETAQAPVNGVGFGQPASFVWSGNLYDSRRGIADDPFDVTGPHNSFINLLYRTGVVGLLAVIVIVAVAVARLYSLARRESADRATAVWLLAALAVTTAVSFFSVSLEGPYMGIFFWTVVGLGLIAPWALGPGRGGAYPETAAA